MRPFRPLPLALLALFVLPSRAQAPAPADPMPGIYVGKSQILDAAPSRQLSLNANVAEYQYQPGGAAIAYVGSEFDGVTLKQFVKLAGVKRGQTTTLYSASTNAASVLQAEVESMSRVQAARGKTADEIAAMMTEAQTELRQNPKQMEDMARIPIGSWSLAGWSGDGKYLLIRTETMNMADMTQLPSVVFSRIDVTASEPRPRQIALPEPPPGDEAASPRAYWSPGKSRILLTRNFFTNTKIGETMHSVRHDGSVLYDPTTEKIYPLSIGDKLWTTGWLDENHLLLRQDRPKTTWFSHDVTSGKEVEIPKPSNLNVSDETPAPKGLTLEAEAHKIVKRDKTSLVQSYALWVKRVSGPKELSAVPVGLTPGPEFPNPSWSPRGNQVAYLSHGDLFVTDLVTRPATLQERYAAGEKLPCPEERQLAMSNLKQIGLAMMMYSQDYDENLPMGNGGVNEAIEPYLKNADITGFGPNKFVYNAPVNLGLAAVAKPAETVIGTYDTRCAFVKLYADGHVKAFPKPGFENTFPAASETDEFKTRPR